MRKLLWLGKTGLLGLALILVPADIHEAGASRSTLCAAEDGQDGQCKEEVASYCVLDGVPYVDLAPKNAR